MKKNYFKRNPNVLTIAQLFEAVGTYGVTCELAMVMTPEMFEVLRFCFGEPKL